MFTFFRYSSLKTKAAQLKVTMKVVVDAKLSSLLFFPAKPSSSTCTMYLSSPTELIPGPLWLSLVKGDWKTS